MMLRILLLIGVIYLFYKGRKIWMSLKASSGEHGFGDRVGDIDDIMIKDPCCGVYFPKRNGIHAKVDGKDLYFCSKECKEKFIASKIHK